MSNEIKKLSNFFYVFNQLLDDERTGANEIAIYNALCRFADAKTNTCFPSISTISKMVKLNPQTVRKCLNNLKEYGYIDITPRERQPYLFTLLQIGTVQTSTQGGTNEYPGVVQTSTTNNKQSLTKSNEQTYYNTQTTLIPVPKSETVLDGKIPYALATGNWSGITNTDLLEYFVLIHNRNMPEKVALPNGKAKSYLVGLFRDCFIDKYNLSPQDTVYLIPSLIDVYKTHPVVSEKYRNKFEPSAFAQNWLINALMETLQSKKKYSRVKLDVSDKDTPEIF